MRFILLVLLFLASFTSARPSPDTLLSAKNPHAIPSEIIYVSGGAAIIEVNQKSTVAQQAKKPEKAGFKKLTGSRKNKAESRHAKMKAPVNIKNETVWPASESSAFITHSKTGLYTSPPQRKLLGIIFRIRSLRHDYFLSFLNDYCFKISDAEYRFSRRYTCRPPPSAIHPQAA